MILTYARDNIDDSTLKSCDAHHHARHARACPAAAGCLPLILPARGALFVCLSPFNFQAKL